MSRASEVLKNVSDEMQAVINSGPQEAPEFPVAPHIMRETNRHLELSEQEAALRKKAPKSLQENWSPLVDDPDREILKRCKQYFRRGETFREFIARVQISPLQIPGMSDEELARVVKMREEDEKENPPVPVKYMPSSGPKPQPARRLIALGDFGDR